MIRAATLPLEFPVRPGAWRIFNSRAITVVLFFLVALSGYKQPILCGIGLIGMSVSVVSGVSQWRHYNREGWYDKREIAKPTLPFVFHKRSPRGIFEEDGISCDWSQSRKILYSQIVWVEVDYDEHKMTLEGLLIHVTLRGYHSTTNWPLAIKDNGDGWQTQKALAVLREVAPQAKFDVPEWLDQGWFPRLGMEKPRETGGGGGS